MSSIGKIIGGIATVLVVIGVMKGLGDANMENGFSIIELAGAIINGVADLTIFLIPTALDAIENIST